MDRFAKYKAQLVYDQIGKIKHPMKGDEAISVRLKDTNQVETYLMPTETEIYLLSKGSQLNLSKTQHESNKHILPLVTAPVRKAVHSRDSLIKTVTFNTKRVPFKEESHVIDDRHDLKKKLFVDYKQSSSVREL